MTDPKSCSLCASTEALSLYDVAPRDEPLLVCGTCRPQIEGADLDTKHWFCLQESAWSDVPAVQVVAWRLLHRLSSETWANDLLEQLYLDDDTLAWAKQGLVDESEEKPKIVDCNGTPLLEGDSVTLIKDLPVKGGGFTAKRGTLVKNIQYCSSDPTHIEGRVNKVSVLLKTEYLKKTG